MKSSEFEIRLPVGRHAFRYMPLPQDTVRMPNDILQQVIQIADLPSRKIFYIILAQDHLTEKDRLFYKIPYTAVYTSTNNAKARGEKKKESLLTWFQEKSFTVSSEFIRLYLGGRDTSEPISAFSKVEYADNHFRLTLTEEFKLYLYILRKYKKDVPYTSGDLKLLLGMYHRAADKVYWLIRSKQFKKGTHKFVTQELKELLGYADTETRNFCSQTLTSVRKELHDTWAEFRFIKHRKGKEIRHLEFIFDKDEVILKKLSNDFRFVFERDLLRQGFKAHYIHYIRCLILREERTPSGRPWDAAYVLKTISATLSRYSDGKVKNIPAYLFEALFAGYYEEGLPEPAAEISERLGQIVMSVASKKLEGWPTSEVLSAAKKVGMDSPRMYARWLSESTGKEYTWVGFKGDWYMVEKEKVDKAYEELAWLENIKALE